MRHTVALAAIEQLEARLFLSAQPVASTIDSSPSTSTSIKAAPIQSNLSLTFGSTDLTALSYSGVSLLDTKAHPNDGFRVGNYTVIHSDGTSQDLFNSSAGTTTFNSRTSTYTTTYTWGIVTRQYVQNGDKLTLNIAVKNTSSTDTLAGLVINPMTLRFPQMPVGFNGNPQVGFNVNGPTAIGADFGSGVLMMTNDDVVKPLYVGFSSDISTPTDNHYNLVVGSRPIFSPPSSWPVFNRPISPGASDTYTTSLRFGPSGTNPQDLASDIYQAYAEAFPSRLNWSDRRAIGDIFPSGSGPATRTATNPRGWFNDGAMDGRGPVDVTTTTGLDNFRTRFLALADRTIANLKATNAQGIIAWDIEGEQYDSIKYVGDPRMASQLAPELDYQGTVDAYFKKFRDAGLRVGVTIRPTHVVFTDSGPVQQAVSDPAALLIDKINYAKQRWGCTMFYLDSDDIYDAATIDKVTAAEPDILLIPEHSGTRDYAYGASYAEMRQGQYSTPTEPRRVYPQSFSVISVDDTLPQKQQQMTAAVQQGDVLLFPGWYTSPTTDAVAAIYGSSLPPAPASFNASPVKAGDVKLSWADTSSETGYRLQRTTDPTSGWTNIATLAANTITYEDTAAPDGVPLSYRVVPFNTTADGAASASAGATTALFSPTALAATTPKSGEIDLSWVDNTLHENSYLVERSLSSAFTNETKITLPTNATNYNDTGLSAGTYYYRVSAQNSVASSVAASISAATSATSSLPAPWQDGDVGATALAGSANFSNGLYTISGSGANIGGSADAFNYVSQTLSGDGQIIARVASLQNTGPQAEAGVMIRSSLSASAPEVSLLVTAGKGLQFQRRQKSGGTTNISTVKNIKPPIWLKLVRQGSTFTAYSSTNGTTWSKVGSDTVSMSSIVYFGLAVSSHDNTKLTTATIDNVSAG